ncbi:6-carboxytetrahydropterin synthase [uncultured Pseudoteredinibacter sp.]|uniref:6-carboxytetrahydropterin synthase n=1 Tax=uncultured Pseudoteredinibacter sp. TaxID=1641701 RepID=UPI0026255B14|nr:6-carboxytetrahydropterin synthase [uncultured Pseudoteredinibacter sp.]
MLLFVDELTNVDFSYLHPSRGLLGETWLASTELDGALDEQGMVCDFGIVKKTLRNWLDEILDHCLLVPRHSPNLSLLEEGEYISLRWKFGDKELSCRSPAQAITLIDAEEIDASSVAKWSIEQLRALLPDTIERLSLEFEPEQLGDNAFYHYSHGLKKHAGNCQRIAHGHRSGIQIWRDGERDKALEAQWSERWCDIYLGSDFDVSERSDTQLSFAYQSAQGNFDISLPATCCELLPTDTTVEWIACYIAEQLKKAAPGSQFKVRAFEGIGKGAVYQI